jgi:hypothetical protein
MTKRIYIVKFQSHFFFGGGGAAAGVMIDMISEHQKTVAQKHHCYKIEILIYHTILYAFKTT